MTVEKIIMAGVVLAAFIIVMMALSSCAKPQPFGEDIWLGVRQMERAK